VVRITYVAADGEARTVEARVGQTAMEAAVKNGVAGIVAECGGSCACGTCRVYVESGWQAVTGEASAMEREMLDFGGHGGAGARLSCQITVRETMDGLILRMPASQY
jgi:2Fe-2S ferredoxin